MNELTKDAIELNKNKFISIVKSITRENFNADALIEKLEKSDFYYAPASQTKHNSFMGGLVDHCLNVYYTLSSLVKMKHLEDVISEDSIKIVALFHDFYKMNHFECYTKNEKLYHEHGSKSDISGKFDWVSKLAYKVVDQDKQFIYGTPGETSAYMIRCFTPLTLEEEVSIIHCLGNTDGSDKSNVPAIYNKYILATLLHTADMICTYIDEGEKQ